MDTIITSMDARTQTKPKPLPLPTKEEQQINSTENPNMMDYPNCYPEPDGDPSY